MFLQSLYLVDLETLKVDTLFHDERFLGGASYSPDGKQLLLTVQLLKAVVFGRVAIDVLAVAIVRIEINASVPAIPLQRTGKRMLPVLSPYRNTIRESPLISVNPTIMPELLICMTYKVKALVTSVSRFNFSKLLFLGE